MNLLIIVTLVLVLASSLAALREILGDDPSHRQGYVPPGSHVEGPGSSPFRP